MEQFTRTTTVDNERAEGRTFEEDVQGFRQNRFEKVPGAKVDDIGIHPQLKLREGDREAIIAAMRDDVAQAAEVVEEPLAPANNGSLERLTDMERACLETMREDFDRGIVLIDDNADEDAYQAVLKEDKTAGQSWETVQGRLLANEAALLKKAVELSKLTGDQEGKGARLIGVYENGKLAIRQRSQEIVNARWTKNWKDGQSDKGELRLLFHPEAMAQATGRWAKAVEILRAVKEAGYHVPADAPDYKKKGLVAASEAVTGADYTASPNRNEWRDAMLECPDNVSDDAGVRVVYFSPNRGRATIYSDNANFRDVHRGAVLWLRG